MSRKNKFEILAFDSENWSNPYPGGSLPWQVYQDVRNALVRTCQKFGPTGPMGEVAIDWNVHDPYLQIAEEPEFWSMGDPNPVYYLVEGQYNDEQYCYAELYDERAFTEQWLLEITQTLSEYEDWGLSIAFRDGHRLLIFHDRILVHGEKFTRCCTVSDITVVVRDLFRKNGE